MPAQTYEQLSKTYRKKYQCRNCIYSEWFGGPINTYGCLYHSETGNRRCIREADGFCFSYQPANDRMSKVTLMRSKEVHDLICGKAFSKEERNEET
jgi:hypothetical protein